MIEKKRVIVGQTMEEEKGTMVKQRLATIEEGTEEEEGVEKEILAVRMIGKKQGHDRHEARLETKLIIIYFKEEKDCFTICHFVFSSP